MKKVLIGLGLWLLCYGATAQEQRAAAVLQQASAEYGVGHFEQVSGLLGKAVKEWPQAERVQGYRLLALSYLACDRWEECREAMQAMLEAEPAYTPALQDPRRFVEMIREMQSGKVTLVTASQQAESPEEAPVPVTLITREMLDAIGARTLKEALLAYVPGMNSVESANEVNIAMHGIFSAGQQKILIMLNGHRLNSRSTNGAAPDYSIGLEKVKQIEVLRGPASSLYGNVALTAVVNLITMEGREIGGLKVKLGVGNFGQKKAAFVYGCRFLNADLTAWGSLYCADGQEIRIPLERTIVETMSKVPERAAYGHTAIVEGYKDFPSYDGGMVYRYRQWSVLLNMRYGKRIDPYASVGYAQGAGYTYEKYIKFEGEGIGYGVKNVHTEINWNKEVKGVQLSGGIYWDAGCHSQYSALGDSIYYFIPAGMNLYLKDTSFFNAMQMLKWKESTLGGTVKAGWDFTAGTEGKGNLLLGLQGEQADVYSSDYFLGKDFKAWCASQNTIVVTGKEKIWSAFGQLKWHWRRSWILNAGVRADYKVRADRQTFFALSPRFSLIYIPDDRFNFKLNAARSFVDAPFFYRNNSAMSFKADKGIKPEYLTAVQLFYAYVPKSGPFRYEGNFYYNYLSDFVFRDRNRKGQMPKYRNADRLHLAGWENTLILEYPRIKGRLNFSALTVIGGKDYDFSGKRVCNVPPLTVTWVVSGNVWKRKDLRVWINADGSFTAKQLSPIQEVTYLGGLPGAGNTVEALWLLNAGLRVRWKKLEMNVNGYNVTDKRYEQGGTTLVPYRQAGRNLVFGIGYTFVK